MIRQATLLLILSLITLQSWAIFSAQLARDAIREGETVQLLLQSDGQQSGEPDTTPLLDQFEVLGSSHSSQVNIINGKMNARTSWNLTLAPKQLGTLTIPALEFNGEFSSPLMLEVKKAETASASKGSPLFIETTVDQPSPYVQQMVHYRVQLYYRAKLAEGTLSDPQLENTLVQRLGEDREYTAKRNGIGYQVVERNYALFPQQSGSLTIPAPILDARVIQATNSGRGRHPLDDLFNSRRFNTTQAIRIRGEEQTLTVRPRPASHQSGIWLPAEEVRLSDSWEPEGGEIQVGVPLSRTLTIEAKSVAGTMLPELTPEPIQGFKLYPEPSTDQTERNIRGMVGSRVRKIAYIPTQAGTFTLPPIELLWWNTQTDRAEVALVPGTTLTVLPTPGSEQREGASPTPPPKTPPLLSEGETTLSHTNRERNPIGQPQANSSDPLWRWVALLFALLWLTTLILWWWRSRGDQPSSSAEPSTSLDQPHDCGATQRGFVAACLADDPQRARTTLLQWAACHWPDTPPSGLDALALRLEDTSLREALAELDRTLYQQDPQEWRGGELASRLTQLPQPSTDKRSAELLRPLYPQSG